MATRPQEPRPPTWSAATAPQAHVSGPGHGTWLVALAARLTVWLPILVWAALIFALSSIPSLGTGLGTWDTILRKCAHVTEYAVLAFLLRRALSTPWAFAAAVAYALSDEFHQTFVRGRHGAAAGRARSTRSGSSSACSSRGGCADEGRRRARRPRGHARALAGVARRTRRGATRRSQGSTPPRSPADRGAAAEELDRWAEHGIGDWRASLERFAEDHAPVHVRRDAAVAASAARRLRSASSPTRRSRSRASCWRSSAPTGASRRSRRARARSTGCWRCSATQRSCGRATSLIRAAHYDPVRGAQGAS